MQFVDNITAADQLAVDENLGKCRPFGIFGKCRTNVGISDDVHGMKRNLHFIEKFHRRG